jgi:hypothetical protein
MLMARDFAYLHYRNLKRFGRIEKEGGYDRRSKMNTTAYRRVVRTGEIPRGRRKNGKIIVNCGPVRS